MHKRLSLLVFLALSFRRAVKKVCSTASCFVGQVALWLSGIVNLDKYLKT